MKEVNEIRHTDPRIFNYLDIKVTHDVIDKSYLPARLLLKWKDYRRERVKHMNITDVYEDLKEYIYTFITKRHSMEDGNKDAVMALSDDICFQYLDCWYFPSDIYDSKIGIGNDPHGDLKVECFRILADICESVKNEHTYVYPKDRIADLVGYTNNNRKIVVECRDIKFEAVVGALRTNGDIHEIWLASSHGIVCLMPPSNDRAREFAKRCFMPDISLGADSTEYNVEDIYSQCLQGTSDIPDSSTDWSDIFDS